MESPARATLQGGRITGTSNMTLKLTNPAFNIQVLDSNFRPADRKLVAIFSQDSNGNAQGGPLISATSDYSGRIGISKDSLVERGSSYYFNGNLVNKGETFLISVYPDNSMSGTPNTYKLYPWKSQANGLVPALEGHVSLVSNPKSVNLRVKFVDKKTEKPVKGVKAHLETDESDLLASSSKYIAQNSKASQEDGTLNFQLKCDRGTLIPGKSMLRLSSKIVIDQIPSGTSLNDREYFIEVPQNPPRSYDMTINLNEKEVSRISGKDRYETAIESAKKAYPEGLKKGANGAYNIVIASGEDFPDALVASPLAASYEAPILLTKKSALTEKTEDYISQAISDVRKNDPSADFKIHIVGGDRVVSSSALYDLEGLVGKNVSRIAGNDRVDTSIRVAREINKINQVKSLFICDGIKAYDSLSASSPAARDKTPILLTNSNSLNKDSENLIEDLAPGKAYIVGGDKAISNDYEKDLKKQISNVERIYGRDRYRTSEEVAYYFYPGAKSLYLATGEDFADALTGSIPAYKDSSAILLISPKLKEVEDINYIKNSDFDSIYIVGGDRVISNSIEGKLKTFLEK